MSADSRLVPDEAVLAFSCDRMCAVDILVVAAQNALDEIWRLVNSCSLPQAGANTPYSSRDSNSRCSNSGTVPVATTFRKSSTETMSCRSMVARLEVLLKSSEKYTFKLAVTAISQPMYPLPNSFMSASSAE